MMGFNSNGHGGTAPSSFSNLSSLASPFPINPSLSKQNPNLVNLAESHYTRGPSYPFAFKPPDHNLAHLHPPPSIPSSFPAPNSRINSIQPTALPSTSSYGQTSRPYFPHYPPSATPGNNYPLASHQPGFDIISSSNFVPSERSLQNDYTQRIPGLGHTAAWGGFRNGMNDGEHGRRMENDRYGSSTYKSLLDQDFGIAAIQQHLSGIEPLDESNYTKWKSQIAIILGHLDYDVALLEPKPNEPEDTSPEFVKAKHQKWIKANRMCILIIRNSIPEIIRCGIPETDSAKELMDIIKAQFSGSTKPLIGVLISQLCAMKFNGQGSVREHITKMANLVYKLKDLNMVLPDDFLVHVAINSLPSVYMSVKVNFNTAVEKWSVNELLAQCVREEAMLRQGKAGLANLTTLGPMKKDFKKSKNKKLHVGQHSVGRGAKEKKGNSGNLHGENTIGELSEAVKVCFFCQKSGHIVKNCELSKLKKQNGVPKPANG